jgi:hypothetical protein
MSTMVNSPLPLRRICWCLGGAGAKLLWGGSPLKNHSIPECYGAIHPTAVYVPLAALANPRHFELATTEVFGPFQVITEYNGECLMQPMGQGRGLGVGGQVLDWRCARGEQ